MKYSLQIEGFEGQNIELDPPGFLKGASIFVNGSPVPKKKQGQFILRRIDGQEVIAKVKPSLFYDAPSVDVNGKIIRVVEPLAWYQYLLSSVPLILIVGGLLGALIAIGLIMANIKIFRSSLSTSLKYISVCALSFVVPCLYLLFSVVVYALNS
jgi:hypothetical protein